MAALVALVDLTKSHLHITWSDDDTDTRLLNKMASAELAINYLLGAAVDITVPGPVQQLYLNYMTYSWAESLDQFEEAYRADILRLRHYYAVKGVTYDPETFESEIFTNL